MKPRDDNLVQPLRVVQILQPVLAEMAKGYPWRKIVRDNTPGCSRKEYLSAVCSRADPCRPMNIEADILSRMSDTVTRMKPHSDAYARTIGPAMTRHRLLGSNRRCDGIPCTAENNKEAVACGIDLCSSITLEDTPQQPPVIGKDCRIDFTRLLQQQR